MFINIKFKYKVNIKINIKFNVYKYILLGLRLKTSAGWLTYPCLTLGEQQS